VKRDTERDYYMGAEDAKDYGLIDEILLPQPKKVAGGAAAVVA
jgi:ATP-dependent protease ClpP protease subunit